MAHSKKIEDIKPARGSVKAFGKKKKIIKGDESNLSYRDVENVPRPPQDVLELSRELEDLKLKFVQSLKNVNELMKVKTLPENKSQEEKNIEASVVNELCNFGMELDEINNKEGMVGMIILAIRQAFSLRDAGNVLAYKMSILENNISDIKNRLQKLENKLGED
jgi:hypothetical protein